MAEYNKIDFTSYKRLRATFGRAEEYAQIPNLIGVQRESYRAFLQEDVVDKSKLEDKGLHSIFKSYFPIEDYEDRATLEYISYRLGDPKYEVEECVQKGVTYAAPLYIDLRLILWEKNPDTGVREIKSIKQQEVQMGEMPLMTQNGSFVINGAERVVVLQMHRSPGVFYDHDGGKTHISGKKLYFARIIPYRGSWLDIEFDHKDILYFRIDRKRKIYITTLLRCMGLSKEEIFDTFYNTILVESIGGGRFAAALQLSKFRNTKLEFDLVDADTGEIILEAGVKVTPRIIDKLNQESANQSRRYLLEDNYLVGKYVAHDIIDETTGEIILELSDEITEEALEKIRELGLTEIRILDIDYVRVGPYLRNTYVLDKNQTKEEALAEVYRVLRPGEPSSSEVAQTLFNSLFFDPSRYDLAPIGRMKLNAKHNLDIPSNCTILTKKDILAVIDHVIKLRDGRGEVDDIDHLGNRRVRCVGELLDNQYRIGVIRMERSVRERMSSVDLEQAMPADLINYKPLLVIIKDFFGTSQLSQFMDQTNPLSEIGNKRRISALGPGGLSRDRAVPEARDVHPTHYGRLCPIETPEGGNIGLISSLAVYAKVNEYGFIETPCRKVVDGVVTDDIVYLSAIEETDKVIADAKVAMDRHGKFLEEYINCRKNGEPVLVTSKEIDYVEVSAQQMVSVAASLIPFLENDDANRALMGSNMQRQAVPLLESEAPLVGTGMERIVARDSGAAIRAKRAGVVEVVDANRIVIRYERQGSGKAGSDAGTPGVDIYKLIKYRKSNQNTCINQLPIVKVGDVIEAGDIIADGQSTDLGELALGKNILVAFMPWNGYNFEDSILISEAISKEDVFTSLHIEELEVIARDTRLGAEEITRDIPNISEENLSKLDEVGIVHVGAEVKAGDILIGKVTPKTESPITPEEKLLRAIFGEKAADVRDSSLRVPSGIDGVVVGVKLYTRRGVEKDDRAKAIEKEEVDVLSKDREDEIKIISDYVYSKVSSIFEGKVLISEIKGISKGDKLTRDSLYSLSLKLLWKIIVDDASAMAEFEQIKTFYDDAISNIELRYKQRVAKVQSGDDLPHGALKVVRIYIVNKLKLQPGDKMAGRHGNKGVVSKIVPVEDMPFLDDGTPVDIVLNPLGVPSRMNVGQILETHLGWASYHLGKRVYEITKEYENNERTMQSLVDGLLECYKYDKNKAHLKAISSMNKKQLLELCYNLRKGIPFATPVFEGAKEEDIDKLLELASLNKDGLAKLRDGRTGEYFDRDVTVGYIYMMKLDHLVNDKIHARSIGPYSLVTQQPLSGRSQFGGQRFGEMECWALQAYGASYSLQEMLTVKSDDVVGRVKMYESIIRGDNSFESGVPESFNVMMKELMALCLDIELLGEVDETES